MNFIALLALLAFGSGWDAELRATGERRRPAGDGAADLALRGLFSLHISGRVRPRKASAAGMRAGSARRLMHQLAWLPCIVGAGTS